MSTASISRRQGLQWLGAAVAGTALPALAQTAAAAPERSGWCRSAAH
jgi:iron complex transport system substrate-binding protein